MIYFIRYSKQPYWPPTYGPDRDDVLVGDFDDQGGAKWEFPIRQHIFRNADAVIRVEICQDSVQALDEPIVVRAIRSIKGCRTLDEAEKALVSIGIPERAR